MPDKSRIDDLLTDAAERSINYRENNVERNVAPSSSAVKGVAAFVEPMPERGTNDSEVLALLDTIGSPATMAMAGPRFFGFVIGGSLPVTVATNWLTTAWDQNVGMHEVTPATSTLERVAMDWMIDLFGLPTGCAASFVTGATVANFTALAAARNRVYSDIGWNVEADGLIGAPPVTVIVSEATPMQEFPKHDLANRAWRRSAIANSQVFCSVFWRDFWREKRPKARWEKGLEPEM